MKIGVRLPRRFEDSGDYLADVRAMDVAGVDSLWLDDGGYEPWLLLAAIAAVTGRVRLVAPVSAAAGHAPQQLGLRVATLDRLSRGRAVLGVSGAAEDPDGVKAVIELARRSQCRVILQTSDDRQAGFSARLADGLAGFDGSPELFRSALKSVLHLREQERRTGGFELWAAVEMPDDREAWRRTRREYEDAGATGVIVRGDPRLLDLLRNDDEDGDRSDLGLAQG